MRGTAPTRSPRGGRAPPRVLHNLFFALRPGEDVRDRIEAVARQLESEHAPAGRWLKPHRYHMTLCYLGAHAHVPDALVADALAAGDSVRAPAFGFVLDIAGSFGNPGIPWWVGCNETAPALAALCDAIAAGLSSHPDGGAHRVPHVTILRDGDRRLPQTSIAPIPWSVDDFVLIDSLIGPESKHTVLRRWRLSA